MADDTFASSAVADGYVSCIYRIVAHSLRHDATTALEDTTYLFICDGPVLFFHDDKFTRYRRWEQVLRMQQDASAKTEQAAE